MRALFGNEGTALEMLVAYMKRGLVVSVAMFTKCIARAAK